MRRRISKVCSLIVEEGKTTQQKKHLLQDALKNGGAENFDGVRVLRTLGGDAQFPV